MLHTQGIRYDQLDADPTSPQEGETWYNVTEGRYKCYRNGVVGEFGGSTLHVLVDNNTKNQNYTVLGNIIFEGTDRRTPQSIDALVWVSDVSEPGDIKIVRVDNGDTVVEKTGIDNASKQIVDLGTLSNLPSGKTILEVQARVPATVPEEKIYIDSILVEF